MLVVNESVAKDCVSAGNTGRSGGVSAVADLDGDLDRSQRGAVTIHPVDDTERAVRLENDRIHLIDGCDSTPTNRGLHLLLGDPLSFQSRDQVSSSVQ